MKNQVFKYVLYPYRWYCIALIFLHLGTGIFEALSVASFYPLIGHIMKLPTEEMQNSAGVIIEVLQQVSKQIPVMDPIVAAGLLAIAIVLISTFISLCAEACSVYSKYALGEIFLNRIFKNLFGKEYDFFVQKKQGDILYYGTQASLAVGELFDYVPKLIGEILKLLAIFVLLLTISVKTTVIIVVLVGCLGAAFLSLSHFLVYPQSNKYREAQSDMTVMLAEVVSGIKQILLFQSFKFFETKFSNFVRIMTRSAILSSIFNGFPAKIAKGASLALIVGFMVYYKMNDAQKFTGIVPLVAVYLVALQKILPSISNIGLSWMEIKKFMPRLEMVYNYMNEKNKTEDSNPPCPNLVTDLKLRNIDFSYPGSQDKKVISGLSMDIPKNKTTAIVGGSGAGKSTLVDLITKIYNPSGGEILLDGKNINEFSEHSWKNKISLVTQESFIFNFDVIENIKVGNPTASDEEVVDASKFSYAHEFIEGLQEKYDTVLGDRGVKISGGQKQRISIARAIARKPEILILDEATSALDNISEKIFQENLQKIDGNYTVIIIAHRLTTVKDADKIYVMEEGKVVESGSHDELLNKSGAYSRLWNKQI